MNIKEHIDAGHYPVDDKGYSLVPMRNGDVARIYTTEHGGERSIAGAVPDFDCINGHRLLAWQDDGRISSLDSARHDLLLPPVARAREVTAWDVYIPGKTRVACFSEREDAEQFVKTFNATSDGDKAVVVELKGTVDIYRRRPK